MAASGKPVLGYNQRVLLRCPFCGDLFPSQERDTCPECGVVLQAAADPTPPGTEDAAPASLPWYSPAGGRGAVVAGSVLGVLLFFAPWLSVHTPSTYRFSGFDLASTRGFWFSGGAIAYLVLVALVGSRRTLEELAGVRLISALLGSVTAWQTLFILAVSGSRLPELVSVRFAPAFYVSAAVSVVVAALALRLGSGHARR